MANLPLLKHHLLDSFAIPMVSTKEGLSILIGKKLRDLRVDKQLTIEQVALECGIEYSQLSRIERGKINTSIYHIYSIARALNIPLAELFKEIEQELKQFSVQDNGK